MITQIPVGLFELLVTMFTRPPIAVRLWIFVLVAVNMASLRFWNETDLSWKVFTIFNIGAMIMASLYVKFGFSRILGAGHTAWLFLLPYVYSRLGEFERGSPVYQWLVSLLVINGISVVLDTVDVVKYFQGETKPMYYYSDAPKGAQKAE